MLLKFGNHKLNDSIGVFNMSSATDCSSKKLGLCPIYNNQYTLKHICGSKVQCYATRDEGLYKAVLPSRRAQEAEWQSKSSDQLICEFSKKIKSRRKETNYIRFNEAGDFHNQSDITKLSDIAKYFKEEHNITTYGYTARRDLDFSRRDFVVRGSGWSHESLDGTTTVISKEEDIPDVNTWIICRSGCGKTCNICMCDFTFNVAFLKH
ncbi:MAG: hypothetical protein M0R17_02965 [Candidatus Omnitrophica bacterium]|jgi:hypothetical protein|nr:hypothetical protein [Candidatus Omnitrophota bacterium]